MYIYESCVGNIYCLNGSQDTEDLYCDICGDYDNYIGYFDNVKDFLIQFADNIHIDKQSCGFVFDYIYEAIILKFNNTLSKEECIQIIKENQSYNDNDIDYMEK